LTQKVVFTHAARVELIEAQDWYEGKAAGLGARFRREVDAQVRHVADNPQHFPVLHADIHRARLRRFPYGLFFRVRPEAIYVIACFHASRDPRIWQSRS
jgi:toxin ParE1/3/4